MSFAGLLSKEAVAAGSFTNTGKVNKGFIGTKDVPFVTYTADLTDNDASENPFATGAFGTEDDEGARRAYAVTLPEGTTATASTGITYDGKFYTTNDVTVTLTPAERTGYQFNGYKVDGTALDGYTYTTGTDDAVIEAVYTANTYAVVFDKNGGSGEMDNHATISDPDVETVMRLGEEVRGRVLGCHFA